MTTFAILGGCGGLVAVLTAIVTFGRAIFRMVRAAEANTRATDANTKSNLELSGKVESLFGLYGNHETRITVLEDRIPRHS